MPTSRASFRSIALYAGALLVASILGLCAYVAFEPSRSAAENAGPEGGEISAETLAALRPLAAEIGGSRKLTLWDAPEPFEDIAFSGKDGAAATLSDFRGKIVLLNFWATWCGPCLAEMPALDALEGELGGEDFAVVAVSLDRLPEERPRGWLEKKGVAHLAFYQDRSSLSARSAKLQGMPTTLLIDRQGRELGRLLGPAEWDGETAKTLIRALIDGAPPA